MEGPKNVQISGAGKINGGKFDEVEISGMGQILGDVEANRIEISGMGTLKGHAKAKRFLVSGNGTVEGDLEGEELDASGNFKVNGQVAVKEIRNQGRGRFNNSIKAEKLNCYGYLNVGNDVEAEDFLCNGSFAIEGLLNANRIEIEINGFCYAKEMGGEEILVKNAFNTPWHFLNKIITPFLGHNREMDKLTTDLIEGTTVSICHTNAKVIRCSNIKIGPGCNVGEVEYSGTLEIDQRSVVGKQTKVN